VPADGDGPRPGARRRPRRGRGFRRAVPQLEVALVAGAGHDLVADDPAAVAAAAARFLASG
jgi:pimeloyl-ACP methyl ester carboxylesterase